MQSKKLGLLLLADVIRKRFKKESRHRDYAMAVADGVLLARLLERGELTQQEAIQKVIENVRKNDHS